MSRGLRNGIIVAGLHVAIVGGVGAKLLWDRASYPRVWARVAPVDPHLPIRGRYVQLRLEAEVGEGLVLPEPHVNTNPDGSVWRSEAEALPVTLTVTERGLVAVPSTDLTGTYARRAERDGQVVAELLRPIAYFIPDDVPDPSVRQAGEELWAEVTVPQAGPPRPIQLGVKAAGVLTPLIIE